MRRDGMIDMHAHILPRVDDGSAGFVETNHLLRMAASQGISVVIATPHASNRIKPEQIRELVVEVEARIRMEYPDFFVYPGQEIYYHEEMSEKLRRGELLTLADSRYVLTEFSPGAPYGTIYMGIRALVDAGYLPVLAHVERYKCLRKEGNFEDLSGAGCLFQMNYGSLQAGLFGGDTHWCRKQVQDGKIHFLGTDMHRKNYRPPNIAKAIGWLEHHVEEGLAEDLVRENARCIISGESIR